MTDHNTFYIKQGDTSPAIEATLLNPDGSKVDLSTASQVRFVMGFVGESAKVDTAATLVDPENGRVRYQWQTGDTDTADDFVAEWEVTFNDGTVETFPNTDYHAVRVSRGLN